MLKGANTAELVSVTDPTGIAGNPLPSLSIGDTHRQRGARSAGMSKLRK